MQSDPPAEPTEVGFAELGITAPLLGNIEALGFVTPTPIQAMAIPPLLAGRDVVGQARTGTGKTAAFALPALQRIDRSKAYPQMLVLAPTRELADQVAKACRDYVRGPERLDIAAIYGGAPYGQQLRQLQRGVHVVVGTPGRMIDLLDRGALDLSKARFAVIDEADEMLRMGFIDDVEKLLGALPEERQTALFSATFPSVIRRVAKTWMKDPVDAKVGTDSLTVPAIEQSYILVRPREKLEALARVLELETQGAVLVFARTRIGCAQLAEALNARGLTADALHGDLPQSQRNIVVSRLRSGRTRVVIATDVAARGLDVEGIELVVNYDPPDNADTYVHRIGRTGRAGRTGRTILLLDPRDRGWLRRLERHTGKRVESRGIPTVEALRQGRAAQLRVRLTDSLNSEGLGVYVEAIEPLLESGLDPIQVAAAALKLFTAQRPLEIADDRVKAVAAPRELRVSFNAGGKHRVRPEDIMGALCHEAGVPRKAIGAIQVHPYYSEAWIAERFARALPKRMPQTTLRGRRVLIHLGNGPPPANRPGVEDLPAYQPKWRKNPKKGPGQKATSAKTRSEDKPKARKPSAKPPTDSKKKPDSGHTPAESHPKERKKTANKKASKDDPSSGGMRPFKGKNAPGKKTWKAASKADSTLGGMSPFKGKKGAKKKKGSISAELAAAIEGAEAMESPSSAKPKRPAKTKRRKPDQSTKPKRKGTQSKPRRNKPPHG